MYIINSYIQFPASGGGGATTTKVQVLLKQFSGDGNCTCSDSSTYEIWENDPSNAGGDLTLSVNDIISGYAEDGSTACAKVTALNQTGTAVGVTTSEYSDCSDCNDNEGICTEGGGGEGYCLLPHMLVKLQSGILTKVIDLNVGDYIEGPDGYTEVIEVLKDHPRSGYHIINNELHISNDHPIKYQDLILRAYEYPGDNAYIEEETNTVYVGTESSFYYVYCNDNVYTVSGQYRS